MQYSVMCCMCNQDIDVNDINNIILTRSKDILNPEKFLLCDSCIDDL